MMACPNCGRTTSMCNCFARGSWWPVAFVAIFVTAVVYQLLEMLP